MTITKKFLKTLIADVKMTIESLKKESEDSPAIAGHNAKQILKLEGRIQAYEGLIKYS